MNQPRVTLADIDPIRPCPGVMTPLPDLTIPLTEEDAQILRTGVFLSAFCVVDDNGLMLIVRNSGHVHWSFRIGPGPCVHDVSVLLDKRGQHRAHLNGDERDALEHLLRSAIAAATDPVNRLVPDPQIAANPAALMDGRRALVSALRFAAPDDNPVLRTAARYAVFLHPATVAASGGEPIYKVVRAKSSEDRGKTGNVDGHDVVFDDNSAAIQAFCFAARLKNRGVDMQFNHILTDSRNWKTYTALWNLVATPAFLAKLTDTDPLVRQAMVRRASELYADSCDLDAFRALQTKLGGPVLDDRLYESLEWPKFPPAVHTREELFDIFKASTTQTVANKSRKTMRWLLGELSIAEAASLFP